MTIDLTSPTQVRRFLEEKGISLKHRFGQNFLVDVHYVDRILAAASLTSQDTVVEVGPGIGVLTARMAQLAGQVVAIEVDSEMVLALKTLLADCTNVNILHQDVLKVDWRKLMAEYAVESFKVVANLPYYITTPVLTMLLEQDLPVTSLVVMVQKEVAERMVAKPGSKDYGAFSVFTQYYSRPSLVTVVPPTVFLPPPKVHSAVVHLQVSGHEHPFSVGNRKSFFQIVKAAFGQRRKMLRRALRGLPYSELQGDTIVDWLEASGIDPTRRGETLSLEEFAKLNCTLPQFISPNPQ